MSMSNIFISLARYNSASDENYLTESLVYLASFLLERDAAKGMGFVNFLAGEPIFKSSDNFEILTQFKTEASGTPDIVLQAENKLVFVEVKHDSPLGYNQLERYLEYLESTGVQTTRLIFLTRTRLAARHTSLLPDQYFHRFWYEIYSWFSVLETDDVVIKFLILNFLDFLDTKNMSLKKVQNELAAGIESMLALTQMLIVVLGDFLPEAKITKTAGWSWRGYFLPGNYWIGFRFESPTLLVVEDNRGYHPVTFHQELDLAAAGFFDMAEGEQVAMLAEFVERSLDGVDLSGGDDSSALQNHGY